MKLRLNINGGSMEDIVVLQNILNNYDVRVDVYSKYFVWK